MICLGPVTFEEQRIANLGLTLLFAVDPLLDGQALLQHLQRLPDLVGLYEHPGQLLQHPGCVPVVLP